MFVQVSQINTEIDAVFSSNSYANYRFKLMDNLKNIFEPHPVCLQTHTDIHTNLKRPEEMQVLMRGRNGGRQLSCPWPSSPSGALWSAASTSFNLKHMVTGQLG